MTRFVPFLALITLLPFAPTPASAQAVVLPLTERVPDTFSGTVGAANDRRTPAQLARITVQMNFFVAGPTDDSDKSTRSRERARRSIYETAGKECKLLLDVLADDCRLESLNVNVGRQTQQQLGQQVEGFMVSGNATYRIIYK